MEGEREREREGKRERGGGGGGGGMGGSGRNKCKSVTDRCVASNDPVSVLNTFCRIALLSRTHQSGVQTEPLKAYLSR